MIPVPSNTRVWLAAGVTDKVPRAVQFVADLPKTSTGKIMRRELKTLDSLENSSTH